MSYNPPGWLADAVKDFGLECKAQLQDHTGEPEAAIRPPIEHLLKVIANQLGHSLVPHGEAPVIELGVRPDYAMRVDGAVTGYLEVKKPNANLDPSTFHGHTGPGFKGMRRYLRATCSEGWIINVSPERGAQPDVPTRLFPGVQRKLAIGIFVREAGTDTATPAVLHYTEVVGRRDAKYAQLGELKIDDSNWQKVRDGWDAPFTPGAESWDDYPALGDLFPWVVPGIKANRTWVYAPAPAILQKRWTDLITEKDPKSKSKKLKKTDDRDIDSSVLPLPYGNQHGRRTAQSGPPTSRRSSPNCWHGTNRRLGAAAAPAASLKRPPDPRPVRHGAREASTCSSAPAAPTTGAAPMASATFTRPPTAGTPTASTGQPGRCSSTPVRRSPASLSRRGPPPFPEKSSRPPRAGELPGLPATP